jgi:hypothetical protein
VNVDSAALSGRQRKLLAEIKTKPTGMKNLGAIYETIDGNHRRSMGAILVHENPTLYNTLQFKCAAFMDIPVDLAWKLASKANLDSSITLENTFMDNVRATRKVFV